ncbi:TPA: hypothetical protein DEB29_02045 [Candidatus Wolfebacteria bacterium]|nr:hypothetical protein [Candidatus Wolfebacteria bacterium]
MDEEIKTKTVGLAETIFLVLLVGIEELVEVAILLVTLGAGIGVVEIMNIGMVALLEMYMIFRGGVGIKRLIVQPLGGVLDGILGTILPIKTISTMIGIWMINNSEKIEKIVGPAGQIIATRGKGAVTATARNATVAASAQTAATTAETARREVVTVNASAVGQRMEMPTQRRVSGVGDRMAERRESNEIRAAELRRKIAMGG